MTQVRRGWRALSRSSATTRRLIPAHKENEHEAGRTKKFVQAQETKEAPCYEEVHSGEEIKGGGSVKIEACLLTVPDHGEIKSILILRRF
jgi:hypothetical protein